MFQLVSVDDGLITLPLSSQSNQTSSSHPGILYPSPPPRWSVQPPTSPPPPVKHRGLPHLKPLIDPEGSRKSFYKTN
ncbi:hypothetical protein Ancab_001701 [Ancistrocladus abbreviatus]